MNEKIEIGYTIGKERWQAAAENVMKVAPHIAEFLKRATPGKQGQEDAEDFMADMAMAVTAINYVANFATNQCRFIPVGGDGK